MMDRRKFIALSGTAVCGFSEIASSQQKMPGLIESIEKVVLRRNRDGSEGTTWFHPRACMIPGGKDGKPFSLMCLQSIGGSDFFGPLQWSRSDDLGTTWSDPEAIPALGQIPVPENEGLKAGVCDVVPQYHPQTNTTLAMGHVVFYKGPKFTKGDQQARYPRLRCAQSRRNVGGNEKF